MSKTILSPVAKWKGSVTLSDPLTFPQSIEFEDAIKKAAEITGDIARYHAALIPGICACVEKWELEGLSNVSADNFPSTPRLSAVKLISWLVTEIGALYSEGEEIPNA